MYKNNKKSIKSFLDSEFENSEEYFSRKTVNGLLRSLLEPIAANNAKSLIFTRFKDTSSIEGIIKRLEYCSNVEMYSFLDFDVVSKDDLVEIEFVIITSHRYNAVLIWDYSESQNKDETRLFIRVNSKDVNEVYETTKDRLRADFDEKFYSYRPERRENALLNDAVYNVLKILNENIKENDFNYKEQEVIADKLQTRDKIDEINANIRSCAHEIKNPLTPIKLEIQRLIRLKQRNDPAWEEKFDKVSAIILEHIDILTDTANEFSTFAKLYSEEPVTLDLDKTLKDQLAIFDNKDNIEITYIGMNDAVVLAPKPQLIRVFVNLITNAIQAIEIMQKEQQEDGLEITPGRIIISLRNSNTDGFYDIVFEDNGPGVKDENLEKLFTPNFTTKSGGTGLGLAICRNIIEKCQGDISYRKSYVTRGACFIVRLPKKATGHNPSHPAQ